MAQQKSQRLRQSQGAGDNDLKLPKRDLKMLLAAAAYPWWPFGKLEAKADVTLTPQARIAIRRTLKEKGYADFEEMRLGKSPVILIWPTENGWDAAACKPPSRTGRGSLKHQSVQNWVAMAEAKEGKKAAIEVEVNGHPVDCAVTGADGRLRVYEVVVECETNLLQSLSTLSPCSNVESITIVCLQKQIQQRLQLELEAQMVVMKLGSRLRWELAETFYRRLWP